MFEPLAHCRLACIRTIMERAKQLVPRDVKVAVVHLEVTMMDLVTEHAPMNTFEVAKQQALKTRMGGNARKRIEHQVRNYMHRMHGQDKLDHERSEMKKLFNRMHGPTAVLRWCKPVEQAAVQQAVHPVEIEAFPHRNEQEERDAPDRRCGKQ